MAIKEKLREIYLLLKKGEIRVNLHHVKTILILLCIASFSFVLIQNSQNSRENGTWNNYGVDCDIVRKIAKGELNKDDFDINDFQLNMEKQFAWLKGDVVETYTFKYIHRPLLNCLDSNNSHLTKVLKDDLMVHPNKADLYYTVNEDPEFVNPSQAIDIRDMIFKNKTNGFFIEAGAFDCQTNSVTFPFENKYGWTGILVEPIPEAYSVCKTVNRQAFLINTCIGIKKQPYYSSFDMNGGSLWYDDKKQIGFKTSPSFSINTKEAELEIELQCYPLYSLLLAVGNPTVNLFVLDIEGFELAVLESIPWDKVDIEVLDIETDLAGLFQKDSSPEKIVEFMDKIGYDRFSHRKDFNPKTKRRQNDLFVRRDIVKKYNVIQL